MPPIIQCGGIKIMQLPQYKYGACHHFCSCLGTPEWDFSLQVDSIAGTNYNAYFKPHNTFALAVD